MQLEYPKIFRECLSESVFALELKIVIFKGDNELWDLGIVVNLVGQRLEIVVGSTGNEAEMIKAGA